MQTKLNTKELQIKEFKYPINSKNILKQTLYFAKNNSLHLELSHSSSCTVFRNVKKAYIYNLIDDDTAKLVLDKLYYSYLNQKARHGSTYGFDVINLLEETRQIRKEIESIERCIKTNQALIKTANKKDSEEYIKKCKRNILCSIIKRNSLIDEFYSNKRELRI